MVTLTTLSPALLGVCLLALVPLDLPGQARQRTRQPATAAAALAAFEKTVDLPEAKRIPALNGLRRFASEAITAALGTALNGAQTANFRTAVVRVIGGKERPGLLPDLLALFDQDGISSSLIYDLARAIGAQGEAAVPELARRLQSLGTSAADRQRRAPLINGLTAVRSPAAYAALMTAATQGADNDRYQALRGLAGAPASAELTKLRLDAVESAYPMLKFTALEQLAAAGHPDIRDLALAAWEDQKKSRTGGNYSVRLAEVLAKVLDPKTFAAFVAASAAGYQSADRLLKEVTPKVDSYQGFVPWLLAKGMKSKVPSERVVSIRLLAGSKTAEATEAMLDLIASKDAGMAQIAIRALGERGDLRAVPYLRRAMKSRNEAQRLDAMLGLHALLSTDPKWKDELLGWFRGKNIQQKVLAMDLLAEMQSAELLPKIYKQFTHRSWLVRAAAYDFCRVVRSLESVDPLIARIDAETGRLHEDCQAALKAITSYRLLSSQRWREWWSGARATFKMPPLSVAVPTRKVSSGASNTVSSFFDIPLVSDRVVFVLDVSGSMSSGMGTVSAGGKSSNTRIEEAKRQLTNVVGALPKDAVFNMIFFDSQVNAFGERSRKAGKKAKSEALAAVRKLRASGGTNIHDALELAFKDADVDTIYLLSDGSPSAGKITNATELAAEVVRWNRTRRIRIHTIAIGSKSQLMETLAKQSGGAHRHVK